MHGMRPRRAHAADARAFAAISRSEIERGLPHSWTASRLKSLLARQDTNAYALVEENLPVSIAGIGGFSIASFGRTRAHLVLHAVTPGLRRLGYGRRLLEWQIGAAMTAGLGSLSLEVRASNREALAFYAAIGFESIGRVEGYYSSREDAISLRLAPLRLIDPARPRR